MSQIKRRGRSYIVMVRGKNDLEPRDAPLSVEAYEHIQRWVNARPVETDYIFTAFDGRGLCCTGRPLSAVAIWRCVQICCRGGPDDIKPHDFRRFAAPNSPVAHIRQRPKSPGPQTHRNHRPPLLRP
ncbi:MAG: site-specific integrase [Caldilineaceae bacterium]